jgi:hypothetical protein
LNNEFIRALQLVNKNEIFTQNDEDQGHFEDEEEEEEEEEEDDESEYEKFNQASGFPNISYGGVNLERSFEGLNSDGEEEEKEDGREDDDIRGDDSMSRVDITKSPFGDYSIFQNSSGFGNELSNSLCGRSEVHGRRS